MKKTLPPLGWFRAFECAARHLSFTSAADELGLTQSAVSQQVKSLESRFGCPLFIRKHRSIALTDEGRRLLPDVAGAIASLSQAASTFNPHTDQHVLTIATSVSIAQCYLVPCLAQFTAANKNVGIRLITTVWPDEFASTTADVHIRFDSMHNMQAHAKALGSNKMILVASKKLVGRVPEQGLSWESMLRRPLIQAAGTADNWQAFAETDGRTDDIHVSLIVDSHGLSVDFAKASAGIALTNSAVAAPAIASGELVQVHPLQMVAKDGYCISVEADGQQTLARKFVRWLTREVSRTERDI